MHPRKGFATMTTVIKQIAVSLQAMLNCEKSDNEDWRQIHESNIEKIVDKYLPSGSGFDSGTQFDFDKSSPEKLVFNTSYHHMKDTGYCMWTNHKVTVTASLLFGFDVKITKGKADENDMDYYHDTFQSALNQTVDFPL